MIFPYFGSGSKLSEDLPGIFRLKYKKKKRRKKKKGEEETKEERKERQLKEKLL